MFKINDEIHNIIKYLDYNELCQLKNTNIYNNDFIKKSKIYQEKKFKNIIINKWKWNVKSFDCVINLLKDYNIDKNILKKKDIHTIYRLLNIFYDYYLNKKNTNLSSYLYIVIYDLIYLSINNLFKYYTIDIIIKLNTQIFYNIFKYINIKDINEKNKKIETIFNITKTCNKYFFHISESNDFNLFIKTLNDFYQKYYKLNMNFNIIEEKIEKLLYLPNEYEDEYIENDDYDDEYDDEYEDMII